MKKDFLSFFLCVLFKLDNEEEFGIFHFSERD
jgi:hypothetical protein